MSSRNSRQHKKDRREKRADRVAALAGALQVPRAVLVGHLALASAAGGAGAAPALPQKAFADPDPYREFAYTNRVTTKFAIAAVSGCRSPGLRRSGPSSTPCCPKHAVLAAQIGRCRTRLVLLQLANDLLLREP